MFLVYLLLLNLNLLFNKTGKEVLLFSHKIVPGNEFAVIGFHIGSGGWEISLKVLNYYSCGHPAHSSQRGIRVPRGLLELGGRTPSPEVCCGPAHHLCLQVSRQPALSRSA